jgi:hypothetical protein
VGAALLALGLALGATQAFRAYQAAVERQQVDAYTAAVLPPAQDAGRLVGQTILPELTAYEAGRLPGSKIAADAAAWHRIFLRTRATFARAPHSGRLDSVARGFDRALDEYATAVELYQRLADPGAAPAALVAGDAAAMAADQSYGRAETALACLRRSVGLAAVPEFKIQGACPAS